VLGEADDPIELHLSCPDSELAASLALADAVDMAGPPVHALVRGTLRGPALAVLCACDRRAAHRNALFVLYLPAASAEGTSSDLASLAEQHRHQVGQLRAWVARTTGQDPEDVGHDLEAGRLLSAEEARDYHLVDELL
jgi:ATP-dependent Clp protease protease subunit